MENLMDKSTRVSLLDSLHNARLGTFDEACTGELSEATLAAAEAASTQTDSLVR
jgi:hypothetical protein